MGRPSKQPKFLWRSVRDPAMSQDCARRVVAEIDGARPRCSPHRIRGRLPEGEPQTAGYVLSREGFRFDIPMACGVRLLMQRNRIASPNPPRATLIVGLMFTLPWAGGCSSEDPIIMEKVVPPAAPGGTSEAVNTKSRTLTKSRSSRPEVKSIKSKMGYGDVK